MAVQGEKSSKIYYSMGEVSEMLDVNPSLVRFWEQKFDIIKPKKNKKGNRMFTPDDVRNLKTIYHLVKERGMTLAGAQKYMKASRHDIERDMELAERLNSIKALLLEVRQSLGGEGTVVDDEPGVTEITPAKVAETEDIPAIKALEAELGNAATEITAPVQEPEPEPAVEIEVTEEAEPDAAAKEEIEHIIEEARKEEVIDALMDDVMEELFNEPEEMLDFNPESESSEPEPEAEPVQEAKQEEPQKPMFIEQTLF